ncbi:helix-turn-helix domain-containing protein [Lactococcus fujiensis]|uniref:helix-turn-helix domain-containing protein n=1 Tax=Lactococcus fujiensis TaxID=610251 RepID=UPI000AD9ACD0|nr:helix-turn-helix transcriptional regulator [Lactococcus fujiensis]
MNLKKSFNQVERELGYPRNALANYRLGKQPSARRLSELADFFDVSDEYLLEKKQ